MVVGFAHVFAFGRSPSHGFLYAHLLLCVLLSPILAQVVNEGLAEVTGFAHIFSFGRSLSHGFLYAHFLLCILRILSTSQ